MGVPNFDSPNCLGVLSTDERPISNEIVDMYLSGVGNDPTNDG